MTVIFLSEFVFTRYLLSTLEIVAAISLTYPAGAVHIHLASILARLSEQLCVGDHFHCLESYV